MQEDSIYFTPFRVSTITCNASLGNDINLDLDILFQHIDIDTYHYPSFIWIQHLKESDENNRGVYPKKRRKSKTEGKKNRFDNQITVIYKYNDEYMPNIKIFKNGNIQLTGIKDIIHTEDIGNKIIQNIIKIYNENDKNILKTDCISNLKYGDFKIRMINTDFKVYDDSLFTQRFSIKRKELHNLLISSKYNNKSSFQPGIYQGVKLEYFWNSNDKNKSGICTCSQNCFGKNNGEGNGNCKKVTIAIFESGSILITGGITFEQVNDAYNYICMVIKENKKNIKKQLMPNLIINDTVT